MKKRSLIIVFALFAIFTLIYTYSYAMNDLRNTMNNAENMMENAGQGIVDGTKNIISNGQNVMENMTGNIGNSMQNMGNTMMDTTNGNDNYTAQRTSATGNYNNFGMDPTMWTWLVMGIVGISIIALVWWYAKDNDHSYEHND